MATNAESVQNGAQQNQQTQNGAQQTTQPQQTEQALTLAQEAELARQQAIQQNGQSGQNGGALVQQSAHAIGVFSNAANFQASLRMARALSESSLVPDVYRGNIPNCLIVLEMANRIGASPLMVAQNLDIIHGRPSWRSTFIISSINACGRFTPLRFDLSGEGMQRQCVAWAIEKATGQRLESPVVSLAMAKAEGWYDRNGSKWKTLPDLMLRYRSAAFFGRLYAPEMLLGMQTSDEVLDSVIDVTPTPPPSSGVAGAKELLGADHA